MEVASSMTDWLLCIVCQEETDVKGPLVTSPKLPACNKLIECINQRADLLEADFIIMKKRLQNVKPEKMLRKNCKWHRICYSNSTNKTLIQRAMSKFKKVPLQENRGEKRKNEEKHYTRSNTCPFDKCLCFFCQTQTEEHQHKICTDSASKMLHDAVHYSDNAAFKTRLSSSISPTDAHAIDVRYHKSCWRKHVFHPFRDTTDTAKMGYNQASTLVEVVTLVDQLTRSGKRLQMDLVETTYRNIIVNVDDHCPTFTRRWLKDEILNQLPSVSHTRPKDMRKPGILYSPDAFEESIIDGTLDENTDMKVLYDAARIIRKRIGNFESPPPETITTNSELLDVPSELYTLIRWSLVGPVDQLHSELRTSVINRAALTITQNIMYAYKSNRQVKLIPTGSFGGLRSIKERENPQVLGLAVTLHHEFRSKILITLLHNVGHCISYHRTLRLETSIANAVIRNTREHSGLYIPSFVKQGNRVWFGMDNVDFSEDTPDGKLTTHATIVLLFQENDVTGDLLSKPLDIEDSTTMTVEDHSIAILPCNKPKRGSTSTEYTDISLAPDDSTHSPYIEWNISRCLSTPAQLIPIWSGFNSLSTTASPPIVNIGALPLINEVAHEWSTLLTVLDHTSRITNTVTGEKYRTIISMDMALYEKVIQIIDANDDMKAKVLPRLGELHTTMAALRALGKSIESSGIDDAWGEGDVFGAATTRQILGCLHYKRCVKAHVYTYAALYDLLLEQFFLEHPSMKEDLIASTCAVNDAYCMKDSAIAKASLIHLREELDKTFRAAFGVWVDTKSQHAMFKSLINYTKRVEIILEFIEATRISNLKLHIKSGEQLGKIFFGMDRLKYMRLWPRYIADMKSLESKDPGTWIWMQDKIYVTKSAVPFTSIGVDHAVEQVNKILKVRGGLVGISNNSNARLRFFLTAPVMAEYSSKFKEQFSLPPGNQIYHHEMSASKCKRFNTNVQKIKSALTRNGNPFAIEGNRLLSIITQAYIPDEYVQEILEIDTNGQALFESYFEERIIKGETSLWAKLKRSNYKLYSSANSVKRIQRRDDVVEIKETNNYHRRLLIISRSNRDIDLKEAIGKHEMTINPRAFFKANGDILPCIGKSQAIKALTDLVEADALEQESSTEMEQDVRRVGIIDGMVVLKKITSKPTYVKTILDLAVLYNIKFQLLTKDDEECITVFDTYKEESHKEAERSRRQDGKHRVHYKIQDDTNIKNLTMERLLSHPKTKHELGIYLSKKLIELNTSSSKLVIASAAGVTYSNIDMDIPNNNHEEADTLMIYHAKLATERYPNSSITIHSVDTDVLLLTVGHFKLLSDSTSLMMKSGLVKVKPIVEALGEQKATALPALHAFTGSDTTGRFAGKGKQTWIKLFTNADEKVVNAIHMLAYKSELTESHVTRLEKFVCSAYCPASLKIETIPELRWRLYRQNDADGDKLPPTRGALKEHALRAQVQASVWEQSVVPLQTFLDPLEHGYAKNDLGVLYPITTQELPAPKATLELVRCKCKGDCSTRVCPCRRHDLPCTELCLCPSEENICCNDEDCNQHHDDADDSDSDDEI